MTEYKRTTSKDHTSVWPTLAPLMSAPTVLPPSVPKSEIKIVESANSYRLQKIAEVQREVEAERVKLRIFRTSITEV